MIRFNKFAEDFKRSWNASSPFYQATPRNWKDKIHRAYCGPSKAPVRHERDSQKNLVNPRNYQEDLVLYRQEVDEHFDYLAYKLDIPKGAIAHAFATGQKGFDSLVKSYLNKELNSRPKETAPPQRDEVEALLKNTIRSVFGLVEADPEEVAEERLRQKKLMRQLKEQADKKRSKEARKTSVVSAPQNGKPGPRKARTIQQQANSVSAEVVLEGHLAS